MCKILDRENVYLAFWKAMKSKDDSPEVIDFVANLEENIDKTISLLDGESPLMCEYRQFTITDPKERVIFAAPFVYRVLQHAIINVCGPLIDKRLVFDTYACRKYKGQYKAIEKACFFHRKFRWCVKLDIRKYFDSIDHLILKRLLFNTFKEKRLLQIFYGIIDDYNSGNPGKGIPIGNLTSQYFANYYLDVLDKYIKEELRITGYVRYMDDMLIYGDDHDMVCQWIKAVMAFVRNRLCLDFKIAEKLPTSRGVPFLGYRIYNNHIKLSVRSKQRYRKRLKLYNYYYKTGLWNQTELKAHLLPLVAFIEKAKSYKFASEINNNLVWN